MNILAVIGIIIAIIGLLLIILITKYNEFQWQLIKIDKGETNIISSLEKKYNILLRYYDYLDETIKINNDSFDEYKLLNTKIAINKLNKKVNEMNNIINKYMDNNEKLLKQETIINFNKELFNINIAINGCKKYYNDNLEKYNHLVNSFPSKIIAKLFRYKVKDFMDEEIKDELKILSDDESEEE